MGNSYRPSFEFLEDRTLPSASPVLHELPKPHAEQLNEHHVRIDWEGLEGAPEEQNFWLEYDKNTGLVRIEHEPSKGGVSAHLRADYVVIEGDAEVKVKRGNNLRLTIKDAETHDALFEKGYSLKKSGLFEITIKSAEELAQEHEEAVEHDHHVHELTEAVMEEWKSKQEEIAERLAHALHGHGHAHPHAHDHGQHTHHDHIHQHHEEGSEFKLEEKEEGEEHGAVTVETESTHAVMLTALAAELPQTPAEAVLKLAAQEATIKEIVRQQRDHQGHKEGEHGHHPHKEKKHEHHDEMPHKADTHEQVPMEHKAEPQKEEVPAKPEAMEEMPKEQKGIFGAVGAAAAAVYGYMLRWRRKTKNEK